MSVQAVWVAALVLAVASVACSAQGPSLYCPHWQCGGECCQAGSCVSDAKTGTERCECIGGWTNTTQGCDALSCPFNATMHLHPGNQAPPGPMPPWQQWHVCECANDYIGMACMTPTTNASCRYAADHSPEPHRAESSLIDTSNVIVNDISFACNITGSWNKQLGGHGTGYIRCQGGYSPEHSANNTCFISINTRMCSQVYCAQYATLVIKLANCAFALQADGKMHYECLHTEAGCANKAADYTCSTYLALVLSGVSGKSSFVCDPLGPS
ncbi:ABC transporter [Thecamonas trahens ATCC 50062]|uniref:ABC transporter n=1 Tax=Thecamonas trahens ATCC 50062 TaxID=461836 RepID=A0A0L0D966_THETB|nr:ABC transporter [Thecamonas trahens ATCC 50062]KNC48927.1 ABC transporter [Thecamonas trahens ATCC 50062]|eukprot:XP_013758344.1 ABC transporter [Thecamonas trahens ATCC 50062]